MCQVFLIATESSELIKVKISRHLHNYVKYNADYRWLDASESEKHKMYAKWNNMSMCVLFIRYMDGQIYDKDNLDICPRTFGYARKMAK